jgi:hypothetical protein
MKGLTIKYDDLDWEDYHCPYGAIYENKKFTGIAFDEFGNKYQEWSFLNGIYNGRNYCFDKDRQELLWEEFYENGVPINTHFYWTNNLSIKHIKNT